MFDAKDNNNKNDGSKSNMKAMGIMKKETSKIRTNPKVCYN